MPSKTLAVASILLLGAWAARADLDLTPSQETHKLERVPITSVVFHDGPKQILYQPPHGWTVSGSHAYASLSIPEHPQAKAIIQSLPRLRVPTFDDKAAKLFQDNPGLLQLPKGAKNVKITAVTLNPLIVDSHHTLEVEATYSFYGQACAKSLLLIDRNGSEVCFALDTLASDYEMLHSAFRSSIFSVENL